jgi:hypothetical protein
MGLGGRIHAPAALTPPPADDPLLIVKKAGWNPGPICLGAEYLASTGIRSPNLPFRGESLYRLSHPVLLASTNTTILVQTYLLHGAESFLRS